MDKVYVLGGVVDRNTAIKVVTHSDGMRNDVMLCRG